MSKLQAKLTVPPARVCIDEIIPNLDNGRFPSRAVLGRNQKIRAVILCDGHDLLKADLLTRHEKEKTWLRTPMMFTGNDTYEAEFKPENLGTYFYTVESDIDDFATWRDGYFKKLKAGEATEIDLQTGINFLDSRGVHKEIISEIKKIDRNNTKKFEEILYNKTLSDSMRNSWEDADIARYSPELPISVDPQLAAFSAWYEFFPRSKWKGVAEQGTLKDSIKRLEYISGMGFNIVYLPPIHPIGEKNRKGPNNSLETTANDPGSPWAIGNKNGGHKAIDPALGNFKDFDAFIKQAKKQNLAVAMDIAFQCSPDHPYVKEHPEWFKKRADNTIQYAENPPKKYQDIYPFDFECAAWESLWQELKSVMLFWAEKGIRVFRVDNPHTKAFPFWEWAMAEIRKTYPEIIFLAEAFTKPHVMAYLAKIGFNQSYTYFAWRYSKNELIEYMNELTQTELQYYFRPNFWPNTPDILTKDLQTGLASSYVQRLVLAATLSSNYGIYGPAFELMESDPVVKGKEDYKDSEKYQVREWDLAKPESLAPLIRQVNKIRNENTALQSQTSLIFHPVENDEIIAYSKNDGDNIILVIVNMDEHNKQSGFVDFQIHRLGIPSDTAYEVHDLLNDAVYTWQGWKNYVELNPQISVAHIFKIKFRSNTHAA